MPTVDEYGGACGCTGGGGACCGGTGGGDRGLRIGQRVLLHEGRLREQVGRARVLRGELTDEFLSLAVLGGRVGVGFAETVEQAGDEVAFFRSHGADVSF